MVRTATEMSIKLFIIFVAISGPDPINVVPLVKADELKFDDT